ncbi:MAG: hypothetical protein JXA61_07320 [Bacteroidales bacterium]|nr:hypothetical protein [Bacteroidales bacterium]
MKQSGISKHCLNRESSRALSVLNIVIKMTGVNRGDGQHVPAVKLSDDPEIQTGLPHEIRICKQLLNIP